MLNYFTLILCCQLAGELMVAATGLPVPGPVAGMLMLFAGLWVKGSIPAELAQAADALLGNLSLLFVPAGVGIMLHINLFRNDWIPISVALIVSTILTIAVTAYVMTRLNSLVTPAQPPQNKD